MSLEQVLTMLGQVNVDLPKHLDGDPLSYTLTINGQLTDVKIINLSFNSEARVQSNCSSWAGRRRGSKMTGRALGLVQAGGAVIVLNSPEGQRD